MMHYTEILPDKNLLPFIECYWVRSNDLSSHLVLPDGCIDIVFTFENDSAGSVVGTMTTALMVEASANFVGVRFKSGKANMFLNFNASELTDQKTGLQNIAGREGSILIEKLSDAGSLSEKIEMLNANLSCWFRHNKNDVRIDYVVQKIIDSQGSVSISSCCHSLGLSRQHLARLFQEYVGIGPKQFARVIRFQALLKNVRQTQKVNWTDEAATLGYYDQAHLISDFRQFSGTSPEKFIAG
jgi:AraC-like DNA-binding protein